MSSSGRNASQIVRPDGDDSHLGACRASVATLRRLLDGLFPNAQNPDILTVDDIIRRYPLTQLGAPAAAAMEQSRRILRARRDFQLMGVAEFHTGLIYLYWGDSRAAAQQFAAARTQWSLAGEIPPGCLAHFAQGLALQHGYHFEAAMSQFGWAERCLSRNQVGAQAQQLGELGSELWPLLEEAQKAVRPKLWPEEETLSPNVLPSPPPDVTLPDKEPIAAVEPAPEALRPYDGPPVPRPVSNLSLEHPVFPATPVPGHGVNDDRYRWFVVHKRRDALLPDITEGTWVLVDSEPARHGNGLGQELVVIGGPRDDLGSVLVRPRSDMLHQPYCYLGFRTPPADGDAGYESDQSLILNDSGHALPIPDVLLMGIVVGFWHNVIS